MMQVSNESIKVTRCAMFLTRLFQKVALSSEYRYCGKGGRAFHEDNFTSCQINFQF
jgi:hypothetical protein